MSIPIMSPFAFKGMIFIVGRQWFFIHQQIEQHIKFPHILSL